MRKKHAGIAFQGFTAAEAAQQTHIIFMEIFMNRMILGAPCRKKEQSVRL